MCDWHPWLHWIRIWVPLTGVTGLDCVLSINETLFITTVKWLFQCFDFYFISGNNYVNEWKKSFRLVLCHLERMNFERRKQRNQIIYLRVRGCGHQFLCPSVPDRALGWMKTAWTSSCCFPLLRGKHSLQMPRTQQALKQFLTSVFLPET